ncbi:hypothetical protein R0K04_30440, partial [Pseudoalteromonas sp. SIMBA_153]
PLIFDHSTYDTYDTGTCDIGTYNADSDDFLVDSQVKMIMFFITNTTLPIKTYLALIWFQQ